MGHTYSAIGWNPQKKYYDKILWGGILVFFIVYIALQLTLKPNISIETLIIRGTALTAFILLHVILLIGPLCRLDDRFLPLLYNRRHLGVTMFLFAAIHGIFSIIQFHALGDTNALVSIFTSNQHYDSISRFPFQIFGFFSLVILLFMAATSHDFWLKQLSPSIWKVLHMSVYAAYAMLVVHVATGALQYESHLVYWALLIGGFVSIVGTHVYTGSREVKKLASQEYSLDEMGYVEVCHVDDIADDCAKTIMIEGENIAVFKYDNKVSAIHNVCKHQMGPLGEGRVIDGCVTCPWHGYQYLPADGKSPPPFTEMVSTYLVKVVDNKVWVDPRPREEGTYVQPAEISTI